MLMKLKTWDTWMKRICETNLAEWASPCFKTWEWKGCRIRVWKVARTEHGFPEITVCMLCGSKHQHGDTEIIPFHPVTSCNSASGCHLLAVNGTAGEYSVKHTDRWFRLRWQRGHVRAIGNEFDRFRYAFLKLTLISTTLNTWLQRGHGKKAHGSITWTFCPSSILPNISFQLSGRSAQKNVLSYTYLFRPWLYCSVSPSAPSITDANSYLLFACFFPFAYSVSALVNQLLHHASLWAASGPSNPVTLLVLFHP
jgi:hypothetical protein